MPTAVSYARECLAGAAEAALDEAVSIARRRSHAQTTSLHVVSALLSLSSSTSSLLRDALSRTRSSAHSPRFQFKALEVCFSLVLDRLPSTVSKNSHPPVSNSLMAAIKRSQATQRRNPDTFHLYQHYQEHQEQISQSSSSSASVKVELPQLVLSILDDPIVSRVFSDAGFRSYDIKFSVLHPPPSLLRLSRAARCPPLFLCNFSIDVDLDCRPRVCADVADENCRRIGEILAMKSQRNPLLVGVGAADAAVDFERVISGQKWFVFPPEVRGLKFFSLEKDLFDYVRGSRDDRWLDRKFREMDLRMAEEKSGSSPGTVLSFGDLKSFEDLAGEDDGSKRVGRAASFLTKLVDDYPEKLWLIGSVDTYETYMKFLSQYPSVDKDWDLQLLPISSPRRESESVFPKTTSSLPSPRGQFSGRSCRRCSDKCDHEVASLVDPDEARDDRPVLDTRIVEVRKKKGYDHIPPLFGSSISTDLILGAANSSSLAAVHHSSINLPFKAVAAHMVSSFDNVDVKGLFRSILAKVGRQEEAILSTCEVISRCRNKCERLRRSTTRGDVWLSFLGPDKFGKRRVAEALAEELFGCRERLVCLDLSSDDMKRKADRFAFNLRGKTLVDHIADEIRRRPWSILLLESLDKADVVVQRSLSHAVKSGKLYDSHGRVVDINNAIFLTTAHSRSEHAMFAEERILGAKAKHMKILVDTTRDSRTTIQTSRSGKSCVFLGKRKPNADESEESVISAKRACLDLNLPIEETRSADTASCRNTDSADIWMEEFLNAVDETVVFGEFNFDALADETLREIEKEIYAAFGFTFRLEIEPGIMDQILAAAWISGKGYMKEWLQQILVRSFVEAQQTYSLSASSVVKLVASEERDDDNEDGRGPEFRLPSSVLSCELICHSFL